jgi:hypothetical protein
MNYAVTRVARSLAFLAGDIRAENTFPWFSTSPRKHLVDVAEAFEAADAALYGDVGLHRDRQYLTNLTIPGALKHAWIHTNDMNDPASEFGGRALEATSEGVNYVHAAAPFITDYGMLLRPRGVTDAQRKGACIRAAEINGADYDTNFSFDIESELKYYETQQHQHLMDAARELNLEQKALQRWNNAFSCSEAVAYCWWHARETLGIFRNSWMGREVILPVDFVGFDFDIVWCSRSLTTDVAHKLKFNEQAMTKIQAYFTGAQQ